MKNAWVYASIVSEQYPYEVCVFPSALFPLLQLVSIITDETPIEQMKNRLMNKDIGSSPSPSSSSSSPHSCQLPHHPTHTRKPKLALLREVFGRGCYIICHKHTESNATIVSCQSFMSNSFVVSFRFSLLLAASSPLQPPIGWWHLLLCPS